MSPPVQNARFSTGREPFCRTSSKIQIGFRRFQTAGRNRKFRYGSEQIGGSLGKLVQHARITHQAADGEGPCGSAKRNQQIGEQLHQPGAEAGGKPRGDIIAHNAPDPSLHGILRSLHGLFHHRLRAVQTDVLSDMVIHEVK